MKELIMNNMEFIIQAVTIVVTWFFGKLAKKSTLIQNERIPIQNLTIGIIATLIYYAVTGNWSMVVMSGSPIATLLYDIQHNLKKEV